MEIANGLTCTYCDRPFGQYNPIVNSALQYINQKFRTISLLNELADKLFVTQEYLSRRFSKEVSISLSRYLTMKRIEYAKQLLRKGESLDSICEKCGWNDYSYFIYSFRKETGVTPAKYAKLRKRRSRQKPKSAENAIAIGNRIS